MLRRRRPQLPPAADPIDPLLHDLIDQPVNELHLRPVALRSLHDQRQATLAPYPKRTWFDRVLPWGERALGCVVVVVFGWWLIDGYGRDLVHAYQMRQLAAAQPSPIASVSPTTPTALPHPELGLSLPVAEDVERRPSVALDYLVPARTYIAPLAPPAASPEPTAASPAPPIDRRPTRLVIPALELDSSVIEVFIENGAWQVADYAVGYHRGTGVAGRGNMVLAGHKGLRGAVFARLEQLVAGNDILVDAAGQRYQYRVRSTMRVWPNQVEVMFPTEQSQLTLLTCTNWDTQRFVVVADFVGIVDSPTAAGGHE